MLAPWGNNILLEMFDTCLILSKLSSSLLNLIVTGLDTMFSAKSITAYIIMSY